LTEATRQILNRKVVSEQHFSLARKENLNVLSAVDRKLKEGTHRIAIVVTVSFSYTHRNAKTFPCGRTAVMQFDNRAIIARARF
jgi:hypothetical protein